MPGPVRVQANLNVLKLVDGPKPETNLPPVCDSPPRKVSVSKPKPAPPQKVMLKCVKASKVQVRVATPPPTVAEKPTTQERMAISHPPGSGLFRVASLRAKSQKITENRLALSPQCMVE